MGPEDMKRAVVEALEIGFTKGQAPAEKRVAMARHINPEKYIQHSAAVPDGFDGLLGLIGKLDDSYDDYSVAIHRVIAEQDFVFALCHYRFGSADARGKAIAEVFRFEDGMIVEHWDVIQDVPEARANGNAFF